MTEGFELTASEIVDKIISDLRDRKGLGDEWDYLEDNDVEEIRERWIELALGELTR